MNLQEARIRAYIRKTLEEHDQARRDDPAGLSLPCPCPRCVEGRDLLEIIGEH